MNKNQYNYYLVTINNFMKKYELKNFGVFEIVLQNETDLYIKLTNLNENLYYFSDIEVVDLITKYNRLNKKYLAKFEEIFTKCVGYQTIKSDVNFYLGGVTPWTKLILSLDENVLKELDLKTKDMNETRACKIYSEVIKLDDGKTLEDLVDMCYNNL